jgi:hypothetical protein
METIAKSLGVKKPQVGPKGLKQIEIALDEHPAGNVIRALLGVDGRQTQYTENGFADRGMDAYRQVLNGKFSKEELTAADKWLQDNFGTQGHEGRFIRGEVRATKPKQLEAKPEEIRDAIEKISGK